MGAWGTRLPGEMMSPVGTTEPGALQGSERRLGDESCWGPPWVKRAEAAAQAYKLMLMAPALLRKVMCAHPAKFDKRRKTSLTAPSRVP